MGAIPATWSPVRLFQRHIYLQLQTGEMGRARGPVPVQHQMQAMNVKHPWPISYSYISIFSPTYFFFVVSDAKWHERRF